MNEVTQRIITMTLDHFRKWEVPLGWELKYLSGSKMYGYSGPLDSYFQITVTVEKERDNGI
jgi:hypothetical protein